MMFWNLTAKVFLLLVAILEIFDFCFKLRIKVRGPGQKFLYNLKKIVTKITVCF